jgi:hypothetical protein
MVRACVCVCVRLCVRVCACAGVRVNMRAWMMMCVFCVHARVSVCVRVKNLKNY